MRITALLAVAAFLALTGCLAQTAYVDPNRYNQTTSTAQSTLLFRGEGVLTGDIGPVHNFGAHPVTLSGFDDGTCTYVTIEGTGDNGHGTMSVDVMPRADDMNDGVHAVGVLDDNFEGTTVMSQSWTADGSEYDGNADGGHIIMTKNADGTRTVEVLASYSDSHTSSTSKFVMRPVATH
jgi:hypothetical protein